METLVFGRGTERAQFPEPHYRQLTARSPLPSGLRDYLALAECPVCDVVRICELTKLSANVARSQHYCRNCWLNWLRASVPTGAKWAAPGSSRMGSSPTSRQVWELEVPTSLAIPWFPWLRLGVNAALRALLEHSDHMRDWTMRAVTRLRQEQSLDRLGILGLAYKPGTTSTAAERAVLVKLSSQQSTCWFMTQRLFCLFDCWQPCCYRELAELDPTECDVVVVNTPRPEYAPPSRQV